MNNGTLQVDLVEYSVNCKHFASKESSCKPRAVPGKAMCLQSGHERQNLRASESLALGLQIAV